MDACYLMAGGDPLCIQVIVGVLDIRTTLESLLNPT